MPDGSAESDCSVAKTGGLVRKPRSQRSSVNQRYLRSSIVLSGWQRIHRLRVLLSLIVPLSAAKPDPIRVTTATILTQAVFGHVFVHTPKQALSY